MCVCVCVCERARQECRACEGVHPLLFHLKSCPLLHLKCLPLSLTSNADAGGADEAQELKDVEDDDDDDDEEESDDEPLTPSQITTKAAGLLLAGALVVGLFADPMVGPSICIIMYVYCITQLTPW